MTSLEQTQEFKDAVAGLTVHRWNRTTLESSISRTLVALTNRNLYQQVKAEELAMKEKGNLSYIQGFLEAVEKLQSVCVRDMDSHSGIIQDELLEQVRKMYKPMYCNFRALRRYQMERYIVYFDSSFHGYIQEIFPLEDMAIVKVDRNDGMFYTGIFHTREHHHRVNSLWVSMDEALLGMMAEKHEGPNSRAAMYFCRMIGIYDRQTN